MKFSVKELVDIAVGIEDSGCFFYSECRKKFTDRQLADMFGFLAEEEHRHKELFETFLTEIGEPSGEFTGVLPVMQAIGDERVFKDKDDVSAAIKGIAKVTDVFNLALTAEKTPFSGIPNFSMYSGERRRTMLTGLINEERTHIITLIDMREKMRLQDGNNAYARNYITVPSNRT